MDVSWAFVLGTFPAVVNLFFLLGCTSDRLLHIHTTRIHGPVETVLQSVELVGFLVHFQFKSLELDPKRYKFVVGFRHLSVEIEDGHRGGKEGLFEFEEFPLLVNLVTVVHEGVGHLFSEPERVKRRPTEHALGLVLGEEIVLDTRGTGDLSTGEPGTGDRSMCLAVEGFGADITARGGCGFCGFGGFCRGRHFFFVFCGHDDGLDFHR
jgi:hypothetical protein